MTEPRCSWHPDAAAIDVLSVGGRTRRLCVSCSLLLHTVVNDLDARGAQTLLEDTRRAVRGFGEAVDRLRRP